MHKHSPAETNEQGQRTRLRSLAAVLELSVPYLGNKVIYSPIH